MKHSRVGARSRRRVQSLTAGGIVFRSLFLLILLAGCIFVLRWFFGLSNQPAAFDLVPDADQSTFAGGMQAGKIEFRGPRLVYPYSVVPGGVQSAGELRAAAAHDPTVAKHYSGFDYNRARVIEVEQPKLVYLSYRRGDHVYWTTKQASLHKGEKLLTDGHITARTRCGNQVSVLPQANTSRMEPSIAELDRPDAVASGINELPRTNFSSDLLHADPSLPVMPPATGTGLAAGPPGGFMPMPIGAGGGGSNKPRVPTGNGCPANGNGTSSETNCNSTPPSVPPTTPSPVPEPGTIVLVLSGGATILARARYRKQ